MNLLKTTVNIHEVVRGDAFNLVLTIKPQYVLTSGTVIKMTVKANTDLPEAPVLSFLTSDNTITIAGQVITISKPASAMALVKPGRYVYDCEFTKDGITTTIFGGTFQIVPDVS